MSTTEDIYHVAEKSKTTFRVLHTADWHLGKMLNDQSREEEHALFLEWLLKSIRDYNVDALIVAGDIFDAANPPQSAQSQYYNFISALFKQGGCALVVVAGNHDSPGHLEAPRQVLQALGAHVVGFLPEDPKDRLVVLPSIDDPKLVLAVLPFLRDRDVRIGQSGQSTTDIQQDLIAGITRRYEETAIAAEAWKERNIPVLATGHLTVIGASRSDSEREIHIGGMGAVGSHIFPETFSYVALGHLHRPQATDGQGRVRYSGSPVLLSFSEANDKKEICLIDFSKGSLINQTSLPIPVFRRLVSLSTPFSELMQTLRNFDPESGELETWVEVVVKEAGISEDLNELVQAEVNGRNFKVLKVLRDHTGVLQGMQADDLSDTEAIETLLDDPKQVFRHRLDEEENLTDNDKQELEMAFAQLLDLYANRATQS